MHTLKRLLLCLLIGILLISSTTSLAGVEITDPDSATYQQPGSQVRANGTVRIRANASTASAEVGQIGWGDVATLLAVDGRWYQIDFNGVIGWVAAEWFVLVSGDVPAAPPENNPPPSSDPAPAQPAVVDASSASGIVESRGTVRLRANRVPSALPSDKSHGANAPRYLPRRATGIRSIIMAQSVGLPPNGLSW